MITHDPLDILLAHKAWADAKLFERCRTLSEAELNRRFEMWLESIAATLLHNIAGYRWWADRVADREPRKFLEPGDVSMSIDAHERLALETDADFQAILADLRRSGKLNDTLISRQPPGKPFSRTTGIIHACTHAIYHRAQISNMLRQIQPDQPSLNLDVTTWQIETGG